MANFYKTKLFRHVTISLLGVLAFIFFAIYLLMNTTIKTVINRREKEITLAYRQQIEERLMQWLDEREQDIILLAKNIQLDTTHVSEITNKPLQTLSKTKADFYDVFIASPEGKILVTAEPQLLEDIDISDRDYFQSALAGTPFISGYFKERGKGNHVLAISAPIQYENTNKTFAVLAGLIQDTQLMNIIGDVTITKGVGTALLITPDLQIVGSGNIPGEQKTNFAFDMLAQRITGSSIYTDSAGSTVYGSYSWLTKLNMGLIFQIPEAYVLNPFHMLGKILIFFALLMICAFIFISWRISIRLLIPINVLAEAAIRISEGHPFQRLNLKTGTEIDLIGDSFDTMSAMIGERERILRDMAARDSMTGLYNHRRIEEFLELELQKRKQRKSVISFIMVDIDFFKRINDTYGHQAGDVVLTGVARVIEKTARKGDVVGRYGGEEFAVIIDGDEKTNMATFCERLRDTIANQPFEYEGQLISITVSIGYAEHNACVSTTRALIQAADSALYEAKQTGRNRVCFARPCPIPDESAQVNH